MCYEKVEDKKKSQEVLQQSTWYDETNQKPSYKATINPAPNWCLGHLASWLNSPPLAVLMIVYADPYRERKIKTTLYQGGGDKLIFAKIVGLLASAYQGDLMILY